MITRNETYLTSADILKCDILLLCMEQLYAAMDELLQTESELNALKAVMAVMLEGCRARESQEMEDVLCVFEIYLSCVAEHMRNSIHILDQFLAERKKG